MSTSFTAHNVERVRVKRMEVEDVQSWTTIEIWTADLGRTDPPHEITLHHNLIADVLVPDWND